MQRERDNPITLIPAETKVKEKLIIVLVSYCFLTLFYKLHMLMSTTAGQVVSFLRCCSVDLV